MYSFSDILKIIYKSRGFSVNQKINTIACIKEEFVWKQDVENVGVRSFVLEDGATFTGTYDELDKYIFNNYTKYTAVSSSEYIKTIQVYGAKRYENSIHPRFFRENKIGKDLCEICNAKTELNHNVFHHNLCGRCNRKKSYFYSNHYNSFEGFLAWILTQKKFMNTIKEENKRVTQ
jgi:hypothetical protein